LEEKHRKNIEEKQVAKAKKGRERRASSEIGGGKKY
jgi:hypothetical protein